MASLLLLSYYLSSSVAAPVPGAQGTSCDSESLRSLRDIIVSCLMTIFACTWASLHPNIPAPEEDDLTIWWRGWRIMRRFLCRRLPTFLVALLVPEYIIGWAISQRQTADAIVKDLSKENIHFTRTQAFFIVMGGVRKRERTTSRGSSQLTDYVLSEEDVVPLLKRRQFTLLSENELEDKSKHDWVAKGLVVFQTLWFVIQCVVRGAKGLAITELEVITLGYAILTFFVYIAWWDKPSHVECAVYIPENINVEQKGKKRRKFFRLIARILNQGPLTQEPKRQYEVSNFYAGDSDYSDGFVAAVTFFLLGSLFGAVHLIDWSFDFRPERDRKVWQISSISLTVLPLLFILLSLVGRFIIPKKSRWSTEMGGPVFVPILLVSPPLIMAYIAARVATLYVAVHALRSLTPKAYFIIQPITFIPHL